MLVDRSVGPTETVEYKELVHSVSTVLCYSYELSLFYFFFFKYINMGPTATFHFRYDHYLLSKAIYSKLPKISLQI
jgi:hypothetical protein